MDNGIHHPLKPSFPPSSIYIAYDTPDTSLASPSYSTSMSPSLASAMSPPTPWYGGLHGTHSIGIFITSGRYLKTSGVQGQASSPQALRPSPVQARPGRAHTGGSQGPRAWLRSSSSPSPGPKPGLVSTMNRPTLLQLAFCTCSTFCMLILGRVYSL